MQRIYLYSSIKIFFFFLYSKSLDHIRKFNPNANLPQKVVDGVKNVIGHVRNVDWVKQTSIWPVVRQDGVQVGRAVLTGVCSRFVNLTTCSGVCQ